MEPPAQLPELPPPYRLALAYAPEQARLATLGLLALDLRLGGIVRAAREPLLAQMKLSWWRDRLGSPSSAWPRGEPLLAVLANWGDDVAALVGLVDGWEALLVEGDADKLLAARGRAAAALARVLGAPESSELAEETGRRWGEAELGLRPDNRAKLPYLPKPLRALSVLAKVSMNSDQSNLLQLVSAMRIGLFGR